MKETISKIIQLYNLDPSVKYISKVKKGYLTNNFFIGNSKEKFFLKQYSDDEERIKKTHKAKKFFFQKNIPVVMPLENREGRTYFCLKNKCYALFPYIKGIQFQRLKMNEVAVESVGATLAKIHQASKEKIPKIGLIRRNFVWDKKDSLDKLESIKKIIEKKKKKTKLDKQAFKLIEIKKSIIKNNQCEYGDFNLGKEHIIHGDFHEANIFFNKKNKVEYVFDWECVSYALRSVEVARALKLICFNGRFAEQNYQKALIFIGAYNKIYPIPKEELGEGIRMEYLRQAFSLWVLDEYYLKGNKKVYKFIDDQLKILQYMRKNIEKYVKIVLQAVRSNKNRGIKI